MTKIGRNVAAFGNFEGLLRIWQKFESTLAILLIFGEFLVLKWPKRSPKTSKFQSKPTLGTFFNRNAFF